MKNLEKIEEILTILNEMASNRDNFTNIIRGLLRGIFGEYLCNVISKKIEKPSSWNNEVSKLTSKLVKFMDPKIIKTTFKDRETVLKDCFIEVSLMQDKVLYAKNKVSGYYPELSKKIDRLNIDSEIEFPKMVNEFLPKYKHLL